MNLQSSDSDHHRKLSFLCSSYVLSQPGLRPVFAGCITRQESALIVGDIIELYCACHLVFFATRYLLSTLHLTIDRGVLRFHGVVRLHRLRCVAR
jgi:hypothetical protein